jgi:hypothetical protein
LFHCTSTAPLSYLIAPSLSSRLSCTFCRCTCNFSKFYLGFRFWNHVIFFSLVLIFATSKVWSWPISAPGSAGILNIFNHSLHTQGICYTKYLGDGAAKHIKGWLQGSCMIPT